MSTNFLKSRIFYSRTTSTPVESFLELFPFLTTLSKGWFNKENNVFKDALGVKGLGFKHHGNHPCNHGFHYGNHHGNYHDNHSNHRGNYHAEQLLFSCQCSQGSSCRVVRLSSSIPWDSGLGTEFFFVSMSMLKPNCL